MRSVSAMAAFSALSTMRLHTTAWFTTCLGVSKSAVM